MNAVLYIHGKDGSALESEHYKPLFSDCEVLGLDYKTFSPWETGREIHEAVKELKTRRENVTLIANSIGAFFCMNAGIDGLIQKAYFISPVFDMEKLNGIELTGEWLRYVRAHPIDWKVPTHILFGSKDNLVAFETISDYAKKHNYTLTVMENGEHWFHTEEQMCFLDDWIWKNETKRQPIKYRIREIRKHEIPLMEDFLYEAIFIPQGVAPPPKSIVKNEDLQIYVRNFGLSPDDKCLVAETKEKIVGAVWSRIMEDYGHIADGVPSIAISLYKEYRNQGIGTELLRQIIRLLRSEGYEKVSLSVQKENYASRMYLKAGFVVLKETEEEFIMVLDLTQKEPMPTKC